MQMIWKHIIRSLRQSYGTEQFFILLMQRNCENVYEVIKGRVMVHVELCVCTWLLLMCTINYIQDIFLGFIFFS